MPPCTWMPSDETSQPTSVANALATGVSSEPRSFAAVRAFLAGEFDYPT